MLKPLKKTSWLRHADVALVILISLVAGWAFIFRPSLPRGTDTELHVFRAAELGYALRAGIIFPRWAADYYYGYGYPIFNYYAPLTYYLANLFSLALPGGTVFGIKMAFMAGYLCAGLGTFGFVRRYAGPTGGLIAAACYLFAPYVFLIDPHIRGVLAEFFAASLLPLVFWGVDTFFESPTRKHLLLSSFLVAALLLSHNLMGLIGFGMVAGFSLWAAFTRKPDSGTGKRLRQTLVFVLPALSGLALSAFFWLPVILEQDAVQLGNLIGPGHFDYRNHFLSLAELFGFSTPLDLGAANPAFRFNLGVGQWMLAFIGTAAAFLAALKAAGRGEGVSHQAYTPLFWLAGWAVLVFLMLPASQPIWDMIPQAAFLQFPWRLLGPASLCTAILAGYSATLSHSLPTRIQAPVTAAAFMLPMLFSLPVFVPRQWGDFGPTDQLAMLDFELSGVALGTTSTGDYLPIEVDVVPGPNPELIASYRRPGPIDKVNRRTLPEGTTVDIVRHRPTLDLLAVQTGERFTLRLYTFMFDGWRASVDGQPVPIEVAKPDGFITVSVPAGEHIVKVWLGSTPPRLTGSLVSLISLALLFALPLMPSGLHLADRSENTPFSPAAPFYVGLLLFVALASIGGQLALFQPHSTGLDVALAEYHSHHYLEGGIDLLGYDLPTPSVVSGTALPLTLYWKAREPVGGNYQVFVHLTTIPEHTWGQSDKLNPGDLPTTRWTTSAYVRDPHTITIPPGTPPGEYTLRVGLWNQATGVRQLVLAEDGQILGDSIELPTTITVRPASRPPSVDLLPVQTRLNVEIQPGITLIGAALQPGDVVSAEMGTLTVTLYWQANAPIDTSYLVALRLVDGEGNEVDRASSLPADGLYPTTEWSAGEIVRDIYSFWIDPGLPDGEYGIEVRMTGSGDNVPGEWSRISTFQRISDD
jgi:hypothetical protein